MNLKYAFPLCVFALCCVKLISAKEAGNDWYDDVAVPFAKRVGWDGLFKRRDSGVEACYTWANRFIVQKNSIQHDPVTDIYTAIDYLEKKQDTLFFFRKGSIRESIGRLRGLLDMEGQCDLGAFSVLRLNDQASRGMSHNQPSRRLDKAVNKLMMYNARTCGAYYHEEFKQRIDRVNPNHRRTLEVFTASMVQRVTPNFPALDSLRYCPNDLLRLLDGVSYSKVIDWRPIVFTYHWIVPKRHRLARFIDKVDDELNGGLVFDETKFVEAYQEFLVRPCLHFVDLLGSVLLPALWDTETFGRHLPGSQGDTELQFRFSFSLLQFKVCARVIGTPDFMINGLKSRHP